MRTDLAALTTAALLAGWATAGAVGAPTLSDIATCNEEAMSGGVSASPRLEPPETPPSVPGEKTDPTGSVITDAPDPLLHGMAADRARDPAYRMAYRECMKRQIRHNR